MLLLSLLPVANGASYKFVAIAGIIGLGIYWNSKGTVPLMPDSTEITTQDDWENKNLSKEADAATKSLGKDVDVEASMYKTKKNKQEIESFYRKALSKDGWEFVGEKAYTFAKVRHKQLYLINNREDKQALVVIPQDKELDYFTIYRYDIY